MAKLCDLYEKKSAASQVYWLKQSVDLKMKGDPSLVILMNLTLFLASLVHNKSSLMIL